MVFNFEAIVWYMVLFESLLVNIFAWFTPGFTKWFKEKMPRVSKFIPLTKGWALAYLGFVIWIGSALYRLGILPY